MVGNSLWGLLAVQLLQTSFLSTWWFWIDELPITVDNTSLFLHFEWKATASNLAFFCSLIAMAWCLQSFYLSEILAAFFFKEVLAKPACALLNYFLYLIMQCQHVFPAKMAKASQWTSSCSCEEVASISYTGSVRHRDACYLPLSSNGWVGTQTDSSTSSSVFSEKSVSVSALPVWYPLLRLTNLGSCHRFPPCRSTPVNSRRWLQQIGVGLARHSDTVGGIVNCNTFGCKSGKTQMLLTLQFILIENLLSWVWLNSSQDVLCNYIADLWASPAYSDHSPVFLGGVWETLILCSMEIQLCGGRPDHKTVVWALWKVT